MNVHKFVVEDVRFHRNRPDTLIVVGWFYDGTAKNHTLTVLLDGKELPLEIMINRGVEICQKYRIFAEGIGEEVVGVVKLPVDWRKGHRLSIDTTYMGAANGSILYSVKKLQKLEYKIDYSIEDVRLIGKNLVAHGWCMGNGEIKLSVLDGQKRPLSVKIDHFYKKAAESAGPGDEKQEKLFFSAQTEWVSGKKYYLEMRGANGYERVYLDYRNSIWRKGKKVLYYWKRNGAKMTLSRIRDKVYGKRDSYKSWHRKHAVAPEELEEQKKRQKKFANRPLFSVTVPLYRTEERFFREMIASLQKQTYDNWELCLADGSEDGGESLAKIVAEYQAQDSRIHYRILEKNEGIAGNTNEAIRMAEGDFIVLLDHDDTLAPEALYEFARLVNEEGAADIIYSDEDKMDAAGEHFSEPHFKPDFDYGFLMCNNYICHLFAVKREIANRVGGFHSEYDGSQDYDFILRCCEQTEHIYHVPKILYHWRSHYDSTAANQQSKLYAFEAGRRAIEAHYERMQIPATVEHGQFNGLYRTYYHWKEKPLLSILIIHKDKRKQLEKCIRSVQCSAYRNYEILILDNHSVEKETAACYETLGREYANSRILYYEGEDNLSKIYNYGAREAKGEYLLLLNCETQLANENCIGELLGFAMNGDVGVVGGKIIYKDDTICHAGIILGIRGAFGYIFRGKSRYTAGYESRVICAQDYSAVSGMGMLIKRSVYEKVGGMSEEFGTACGDIDFCLKVRETGKRVVYNPYAEMIYGGEKDAGLETAKRRSEADRHSAELLLNKWEETIKAGDPYYNPNLTTQKLDFSI